MSASAVTLLPQPDSPTRHRVLPLPTEKDTSSTTFTSFGRAVEADGQSLDVEQRLLDASAGVVACRNVASCTMSKLILGVAQVRR